MDSFDHVWWNAHQLLAWAFTRNRFLVKLLADHQEPHTNLYTFETVEGPDGSTKEVHKLLNPPEDDPSPIDFLAMSSRPGAEFLSNAEAYSAIRMALQQDRLGCFGRRGSEGTLERIPSAEWADLQIEFSGTDSTAVALQAGDGAPRSNIGVPRWHGLRFKHNEALKLWPVNPEAETSKSEDNEDGGAPPSRREQRKKETSDRNKAWFEMARQIQSDGKKRRPIDIAKLIEKQIPRDDRTKGTNAENIRRRLNDDDLYRGWADQNSAKENSAKNRAK